jgi:hypothetical protein
MSIDYTAYAAYGVQVIDAPYDEVNNLDAEQQVDGILNGTELKTLCPDVGHLSGYGRGSKSFSLVTECVDSDSGEAVPFETSPAQEAEWTRQLLIAVNRLGWLDHVPDPPHWFVTLHVI